MPVKISSKMGYTKSINFRKKATMFTRFGTLCFTGLLLVLLVFQLLPLLVYGESGRVVSWGHNEYSVSNVPAGLRGVTAIAAGGSYIVALKNDNTAVAWGNNIAGQCKVPGGLTGVTAIAVGRAHTMALKNDGPAVAWGNNSAGQCDVPAGLTGVTAIAAGVDFTVALYGKTDTKKE